MNPDIEGTIKPDLAGQVSDSDLRAVLASLLRFGFLSATFDPAYNPGNIYQERRDGWYRIEEGPETYALRFFDGNWIDADGFWAEDGALPAPDADITFLCVLSPSDKDQVYPA